MTDNLREALDEFPDDECVALPKTKILELLDERDRLREEKQEAYSIGYANGCKEIGRLEEQLRIAKEKFEESEKPFYEGMEALKKQEGE